MESLDLHSDYRMQKNPKENCKEDEGEMLIRVTKEKKEMNTYATSIGSGRYSPNSFALIQFSGSGVSNSLRPHGLQLTRLPYPSPTPGACLNSCPLSWWCYPTISSSVMMPSNHLIFFALIRYSNYLYLSYIYIPIIIFKKNTKPESHHKFSLLKSKIIIIYN